VSNTYNYQRLFSWNKQASKRIIKSWNYLYSVERHGLIQMYQVNAIFIKTCFENTYDMIKFPFPRWERLPSKLYAMEKIISNIPFSIEWEWYLSKFSLFEMWNYLICWSRYPWYLSFYKLLLPYYFNQGIHGKHYGFS